MPAHFVNGQAATQVSLLDRGLLYGHSVFETVLVAKRKPLLLDAHLKRLSNACQRLGLPYNELELRKEIGHACDSHHADTFVLRISQTMGEGGRGYQSPDNPLGTRVVSCFELPNYPTEYQQTGIHLGQAEIRLAHQPALAGLKHSNRLEQIIARQQWQSDWQEALLLDQHDNVIEGTQSNLIVFYKGDVKTPLLDQCGVAGVMRDAVLECAETQLGVAVEHVPLSIADVLAADEVILTNSIIGLWPVSQFQEHKYKSAEFAHQLLNQLHNHALISLI